MWFSPESKRKKRPLEMNKIKKKIIVTFGKRIKSIIKSYLININVLFNIKGIKFYNTFKHRRYFDLSTNFHKTDKTCYFPTITFSSSLKIKAPETQQRHYLPSPPGATRAHSDVPKTTSQQPSQARARGPLRADTRRAGIRAFSLLLAVHIHCLTLISQPAEIIPRCAGALSFISGYTHEIIRGVGEREKKNRARIC